MRDLERVAGSGSGFAVEGPGFYVWQETRGEAFAWARELARGPIAPGSGRLRRLPSRRVRRATLDLGRTP